MNKPNTNKMELLNLQAIEESPEMQAAIERDFGAAIEGLADDGIRAGDDGLSRRRWMQLMGASLALGGTVGCRYEQEAIAPFAFRPANRTPGVPQKFASVMDFAGVAQPILATCYDGRPIKLDGNPEHPMSGGGASTSYTQAAILDLYDPDRLRGPKKLEGDVWVDATRGQIASAAGFMGAASLSDVAILAEPTSSPSVMRLKKQFEDKGGKWFTFASLGDDNSRAGAKLAFGKPLRSHLLLDKAKIIVTLDADPLGMDPASVVNSQRFTQGRDADHGRMSRMYSVESQFSTTGASADHRMSLPSGKIGAFATALVEAVSKATPGAKVDSSLPYREKLFAAMVQDLVDNKGESLIVVGERQPPEVHALIHSLNDELGNNGSTILFTEFADGDRPATLDAIKDFAAQLSAGQIKSLLIVGGNPVYTAPRELKLAAAIKGLANTVHLSLAKNETSSCCKFVSDITHDLESWTDGLAYDGSLCIGQPLISPLFGSPAVVEALSEFMGNGQTALEIVRETANLDDRAWAQAVHDGFVADSAAQPVTVTPQEVAIPGASDWNTGWDGSSLEIVFTPSSSLYDGRFANNAWLQELPDFISKITWDNAAMVSPNTAQALGLQEQKLVTLKLNGEEQSIPVHIQPGQADGSIGVALGYGRTEAGRVGGNLIGGLIHYGWAADKVGQDVANLRTINNWYIGNNASFNRTGTGYKLALTQEPWTNDAVGRAEIQDRMFRNDDKMEGDRSALIREGTFESYQEFLAQHGSQEHAQAKPKPTGKKDTSLPILNNVGFESAEETDETDHADHEEHGHHWPEAFHMHFQNFDITPGSRQTYTVDKVHKDRWGNVLKNRWGMSIDLNKCTGCNACVIACQAENNIPVVGKSQVWRGREMQWLRIDRYFGDNLYNEEAAKTDDKQIVYQPVTCHHCENAPCETVCPVAATVHSSEGLNDMVYNRCIGTRYCGNNCPYKVRRFNYFNYTDAVTLIKYPGADKLPKGDQHLQGLMMNPEVTIRSRGVMEKCTYCVQRIQNTKIKAKVEKREIGPNEIRTACQEACGCEAIKFGDLQNPDSDVAKAHANPRSYVLLEALNNLPRTRYLARVRNPHPALVDKDDRDSVRGGRQAAQDQGGEPIATVSHPADASH